MGKHLRQLSYVPMRWSLVIAEEEAKTLDRSQDIPRHRYLLLVPCRNLRTFFLCDTQYKRGRVNIF
jgi:hypothetical protein